MGERSTVARTHEIGLLSLEKDLKRVSAKMLTKGFEQVRLGMNQKRSGDPAISLTIWQTPLSLWVFSQKSRIICGGSDDI